MLNTQLVDELKSKFKFIRLHALRAIKKSESENNRKLKGGNIQIHTSCSFSPYTPSMAAYMAYKFSLKVAGILDSYTIRGAKEFISACKILGLTYSVGLEVRGDFSEIDIPYSNIALFGIAEKYFGKINGELAVFRKYQENNVRNTVDGVNAKVDKHGLTIDFKSDVQPLIQNKRDNVLLSKYVYFALADKLMKKFGQGELCSRFLIQTLGMELSPLDQILLADRTNPFYIYDLANIISENYVVFGVKKTYADARAVVKMGHDVGAICSFEYTLGKFTKNLTEQELINYNHNLLHNLKKIGFDAVSFDPSKFSDKVLAAFTADINKRAMLPISLSRVEFPRRRFDEIKASGLLREKMIESMYAIVGSEICENTGGEGFTDADKLTLNSFEERVKLFASIGNKG